MKMTWKEYETKYGDFSRRNYMNEKDTTPEQDDEIVTGETDTQEDDDETSPEEDSSDDEDSKKP